MTAPATGIGYFPRWLAGISCYIAFGLGGLLSSLTILPVLRFWPGERDVRIKRVQKAVHYMFRGFVHMLTWAGVVRVSTVNLQRLRQAKGMVVIANHPTLIDVVVLISLMPNAGCIVKQGLWRNPFLRGVVSAAGYIPNRGAELLLQDCREVLARGTNLIIFPEHPHGKRRSDQSLCPRFGQYCPTHRGRYSASGTQGGSSRTHQTGSLVRNPETHHTDASGNRGKHSASEV